MTDPDDKSLSRQLGDFAAGTATERLPLEVVHAARRGLVDWCAAALLGSSDSGSVRLRQVVASLDDRGPATVAGSSLRTSAPFAALANGFASHALDFDDVFNPPVTTIHIGSCVWPALLAVAEVEPISGSDLVAGYVAGFEVGARVASAAGVTHFESGWQVTGTAGVLAATAAACRVRGLDGVRTTHALGMAAAQASGIREIYGSDTKALQPARAAMSGVLNSLMARNEMTSRDTALEGRQGLLEIISRDPQPTELVRELGTTWYVLANGHKLYPNASLIHPSIDVALAVTEDESFDPALVESVEVRMLPFAASVTSDPSPDSSARARFSVEHSVAEAMRRGRLNLQSFSPEALADPETAALRGRVTVVPDPDVGKRGATITVMLSDGVVLHRAITANRGTPERPLSDEDIADKLRSVADGLLTDQATEELLKLGWSLDAIEDAARVPALLATEADPEVSEPRPGAGAR
jgi:2-methylcitrate dehydratase PrpD